MTTISTQRPAGEWGPRPLPLPEEAHEDLGAAALAAAPLLELPAGPEAPDFDGSQVCAQVDPELFFPRKGGSNAAAKKLCGTCEFLNPCRRYAMTAHVAGYPVSGVWGGTSDRDRQRLRSAAVTAASLATEDLVDHDVDEDLAS
jgi:hypothetical protein